MDSIQFKKAEDLLSRIKFLKELIKFIKNSGTIRIEALNGYKEMSLTTKTSNLAPNSQNHQYKHIVDLLVLGLTSEVSTLQNEFDQM